MIKHEKKHISLFLWARVTPSNKPKDTRKRRVNLLERKLILSLQMYNFFRCALVPISRYRTQVITN